MNGRTLGREEDETAQCALIELESLPDERLKSAQKGAVSKQAVGPSFKELYRKAGSQ